jgi:hypothetical protein
MRWWLIAGVYQPQYYSQGSERLREFFVSPTQDTNVVKEYSLPTTHLIRNCHSKIPPVSW